MHATVPIKNEMASLRERMDSENRRSAMPAMFTMVAALLVAPCAIVADRMLTGDIKFISAGGIAASLLIMIPFGLLASRYDRNFTPLKNRMNECCDALWRAESYIDKIRSGSLVTRFHGYSIVRKKDVFGRFYEESGTVMRSLPRGRIPGVPDVDPVRNPKFYAKKKPEPNNQL